MHMHVHVLQEASRGFERLIKGFKRLTRGFERLLLL
jgi:hypothetical protein